MARSFNGTSDIINMGNSATLNITGNLTIACWFTIASFTNQTLLEKGFDNTNEGYNLRISTGSNFGGATQNYVQVTTFAQIGATVGGVEYAITPTNGVWNHLAGTWNGSAWALYYNGVSQSTNFSNAIGPQTTAANFAIGGAYISGSASRFWGGNAADGAAWNTNLSAGEIAALGISGARPYTVRPGSLVGYWPLDGLQSPEPDFSGNVLNGTLTGTALAAGPPLMPFTPRWHRFLGWTPILPTAGLGWVINRRNKLMVPKKRA